MVLADTPVERPGSGGQAPSNPILQKPCQHQEPGLTRTHRHICKERGAASAAGEVRPPLNVLRSFQCKPEQCQEQDATALLHAQGELLLSVICCPRAPNPNLTTRGRALPLPDNPQLAQHQGKESKPKVHIHRDGGL